MPAIRAFSENTGPLSSKRTIIQGDCPVNSGELLIVQVRQEKQQCHRNIRHPAFARSVQTQYAKKTFVQPGSGSTAGIRTHALFLESEGDDDTSPSTDIAARYLIIKKELGVDDESQRRSLPRANADLFGVRPQKKDLQELKSLSQEEIHLQRLLRDPMLSSKGDQLMALMEAAACDQSDGSSPVTNQTSDTTSSSQDDEVADSSDDDELDLTALLASLSQFER